MTEQPSPRKSLIEQILDEMFSQLERQEQFDAETIEKLRKLAADGELDEPARVMQALKGAADQEHESS